MKTKITYLLTLLSFVLVFLPELSAQRLEWVNAYISTGNTAQTNAITTDASGNVYETGYFTGTYDFDLGAGTASRTSEGQSDIFIQKLDASGNHQWVVTIGDTSNDQGYGIAVDASGNVYITGSFRGTVDFNPGALTQNQTSAGVSDVFVLKLNSGGFYEWAYTGGGTGNDFGFAIALDASGSPYIVGRTDGGNFDPAAPAETLGTAGGYDAFYLHLNSSGVYQWGHSIGSTGDDEAKDLVINANDELLISGTFEGTVDFNPSALGTRNRVSNGAKDAFVSLSDNSGASLDVYVYGGAQSETANGIGVDSEGSIYVGGTFDGTVDFDFSASTESRTSAQSDDDFYILKLQSDLSFNWVETKSGNVSVTSINDLAVNSLDQVFFGGSSQVNQGGFIEIYDKDGSQILDGRDQYALRTFAVHANANNYFIGGSMSSSVQFDLCEFDEAFNELSQAYTAKYAVELKSDIPTFVNSSPSICSGESATLSIATGDLNDATIWRWYSGSCEGTLVGTGTSISVSPTAETTYFVQGEDYPAGYSCIFLNCANITVAVNETPSSISLPTNTINENLSAGSPVGTFSTTDNTPNDTHQYRLIKGDDDDDNASFTLTTAGLLSTNETFDFEEQNTYLIRVESEDEAGCAIEDAFSISVIDIVPEAPTDILLDNNTIDENQPINSVIGTLSTTDDDAGEMYSYALVKGVGDNNSFNINRGNLRASESFDYETKNSYSILVETDDGNGGTLEKAFSIKVNDVIESTNDILTFSIPEESAAAVIDDADHTVTLTVPYVTDRSSLTPTLTVNTSATVSPASGVAQNFLVPVTYTVTAEDGTQQVWTVTVRAPIPDGTYSIGSGQDFFNLSNLISYLNMNGISGDVICEMSTNQSSASVYEIEDYPGTDQHSFTLKPASGASNIEINPAIRLQGVENFTIQGMNEISLTFGVTIQNGVNDALKPSKNVAISGISMTGVSLRGVDGVDINGNIMRGVAVSGAAAIYRSSLIYVETSTEVRDVTIQNNDIAYGQEFNPSSTNSSVYGLRQLSQVDGFLKIYNNTIRLNPAQTHKGEITGLIAWADEIEIYHNTVIIEGGSASTVTANCINATATNSLIIKNNILIADVLQTGTTDNINQLGIRLTDSNIPTLEMEDNNITFLNADRRFDGYFRLDTDDALDEDDLATIESQFPGTTYSDVSFVDRNNGDYQLAGASLSDFNLRGTPLVEVMDDIDGDDRSATAVSKGAFESPNNITHITSFTFADQVGDAVIDTDNFTVSAEIPSSSDITDVAPTINSFAGSMISPASGVSQDFTSSITYTVTAEAGNTQDWVVDIAIVYAAPTGIALDNTTIDENEAVGTVVGILSTTDEDAGEAYTYTFVAGDGDADNTSFTIDGDELKSDEAFDFETKDTYSVRINTNDGNGGNFADEFIISINDVDENIYWDGTSWSNGSGPSGGGDDVIIDGDYSLDTDGYFDSRDLTVNSGSTLTVDGENPLIMQRNLINNGSIVVESGSSLLTYSPNMITGNDITFKRNTRYADGRYSFVGSPVEQDASVLGSDLGTSVYKYNEATAYGTDGINRWEDASADELIPGKGYTQAFQQEIVFTGMPNQGTITIDGTFNEVGNDDHEGWVLVANPYPAPIDVADFLSGNTNTTGSIYIWDDNGSDSQRGTNADYIVANGTMATNTTPAGGQTRYDQIMGSMQGFFVKLNSAADVEIEFREDMRVTGNSDDNFFRETTLPLARINLTNNDGLFKQAVIGFAEDAANAELNRRYDAQAFNSTSDDGLFTMKAGRTLSLNGMTSNWEVIQLQLNTAETGIYQIAVELEEYDQPIYLRDNLTGDITDLRNESYSFSAQAGIHTDRFELISSPFEVLGLEDSKVIVYAHDNILHIQQEREEAREYQLFNMKGQMLLSKRVESNKEEIDLSSFSNGIYLVFDGEKTHKIILD